MSAPVQTNGTHLMAIPCTVTPLRPVSRTPQTSRLSNLLSLFRLQDAPKTAGPQVPVVVFLHGSSGLRLKAIGDWQRWLAGQGWASLAPDSFALPGRVTYKSPIDKAAYERIHALRASEIAPALAAVQAQPWADATLGNANAAGHGGPALKDVPDAAVVLVPGAPHTLLNLLAARAATAGRGWTWL